MLTEIARRAAVSGREVVEDHDGDTPLPQGANRVAADVARSAGDEHRPSEVVEVLGTAGHDAEDTERPPALLLSRLIPGEG